MPHKEGRACTICGDIRIVWSTNTNFKTCGRLPCQRENVVRIQKERYRLKGAQIRKQNLEYYGANKIKIAARFRKRYYSDPAFRQKMIKDARKYAIENPERVNAIAKKFNAENKLAISAYKRRWYQKNKKEYCLYMKKYQRKKRAAEKAKK